MMGFCSFALLFKHLILGQVCRHGTVGTVRTCAPHLVAHRDRFAYHSIRSCKLFVCFFWSATFSTAPARVAISLAQSEGTIRGAPTHTPEHVFVC